MVDYFQQLLRSFKDLFDNPIILLPYLLRFLAFFLLVISCTGVGILVAVAMGLSLETLAVPNLALLLMAVPLLLVLLLLFLLVNAWFDAGTWKMIDEVSLGKQTRFATFWPAASRYFWRYFLLGILQALLYLLLVLPAALFILLAVLDIGPRPLTIAFAVLFGLLFFCAALFLSILLFFTKPAIIREELGAWGAIKRSFRYFKEAAGHVFLSWLLSVATGLVLGFLLAIIFLPFSIIANLIFPLLALPIGILRGILQALLGIILSIFLFRMFGAEKRVKKRAKKAALKRAVNS